MTQPSDDVWRKRFQLFILTRVFGLAMFLLGIVITFSDLMRPGGWPLLGGLITIAGVIDAVFAPRLLRKLWAEQDKASK